MQRLGPWTLGEVQNPTGVQNLKDIWLAEFAQQLKGLKEISILSIRDMSSTYRINLNDTKMEEVKNNQY